MEEKKENNSDSVEHPDQNWLDIPFDATTNFSILGWFLDKLTRRMSSKNKIDLILEEVSHGLVIK